MAALTDLQSTDIVDAADALAKLCSNTFLAEPHTAIN